MKMKKENEGEGMKDALIVLNIMLSLYIYGNSHSKLSLHISSHYS